MHNFQEERYLTEIIFKKYYRETRGGSVTQWQRNDVICEKLYEPSHKA